MKLHRLTRTIHIGPCGLRLGRLDITPHPYEGVLSFIWYRHSRTNHVGHLPLPHRYRKDPPIYITTTLYQRLPDVDRDLDPDLAHRIAVMLDTYTTWLNKHIDKDLWPNPFRYTPTQFLDNDPEKGLYGSTYIAAMFESDHHNVTALNIYDGDDGGPTSLTGWFDDWGLNHMTQEFDTMLTDVLIEGQLVFHPTYHKEPQ